MKQLSQILFMVMTLCGIAKAQPQELRFGTSLPLSGKLAVIGQSYLRGIEMAVTALNQDPELSPHWQFKLFVEDNRGEAGVGAITAKKLIESDGAKVIFTNTTPLATVIAPIAAQSSAFMFYASTSRTLAEKFEFVFRDYFDAEDNGRSVAEEILRKNFAKLAVVSEQSDACTLFIEAFKKSSASKALVVAEEYYTPGETNLRPLLLRGSSKKPDAFLLCTWRDTALVMKQLKELELIKIPTVHWVAPFLPHNDTTEVRALLEENHAITTWYSLPQNKSNASTIAFENLFQSRYGEAPRPDSAYVYDDLIAFGQAIKTCGEFSRPCIAKALQSSSYDGVSGPLKFEKRVSQRPVFLMQVKDGKWQGF